MYMSHNINVKELMPACSGMERGKRAKQAPRAEWNGTRASTYKEYTLGLSEVINKLGCPMLYCGMSDITTSSQKSESSVLRHAHSVTRHKFRSMS